MIERLTNTNEQRELRDFTKKGKKSTTTRRETRLFMFTIIMTYIYTGTEIITIENYE